MEFLEGRLGIIPFERYVAHGLYTIYPIAILNKASMRHKCGIGREYWPVYQQLLLFFMAMHGDVKIPCDIVRLIVSQSFQIALYERIELAVAKHKWHLFEAPDNFTYLTKYRISDSDSVDYHSRLRCLGFIVNMRGKSFYVQDIFLNDDWMRTKGITTLKREDYNIYRRQVYMEYCISMLVLVILLIDWICFDFSLSEYVTDQLHGDQFSHTFYFIFNPLRLVGKPSKELLFIFECLKESIFAFFSVLSLINDFLVYLLSGTLLIK